MNRNILIISVSIIFVLLCFSNLAQERWTENIQEKNSIKENAILVFHKIESGVLKRNVSNYSKYFDSQIYLSLSNGVNGYYSSNQAYYVLDEYFKNYQSVSFNLSNIQEDESGMYSTGIYDYIYKGKRDQAQVYVSLKNTGKKWKITQITIN